MARKSGLVLRNNRMRRATQWVEGSPSQTTIAAGSTAALVLVGNADLLNERPFTVIRTRGTWSVRSDQTAASEDFGCSMGWCTAEDPAVAIGVTAVPTPIADQGSDSFFVYQSLYGRLNFSDATGIQILSLFSQYDSKAMRKCTDDGTSPILTMETSALSSSAIVVHQSRMLIKLH